MGKPFQSMMKNCERYRTRLSSFVSQRSQVERFPPEAFLELWAAWRQRGDRLAMGGIQG
jgi:hypothetical protein